jgi:AraC-like DNA-binding protein
MRALIRSATLNGYVGLATSLGLDPARLLRKVGLEPGDLVVPDKWIPAAAVARLLEVSATESGHADFAVRFAELRRLSTLGPLSVVLREEPDLRSMLTLLMRYEYSYNEAMRMRLDESGELATVRLWFDFGEPAPAEQALDLGVAALHGIIRECVGPQWQPLAICFQHEAPADLQEFHRILGPGINFDHDFTGIVFYASDLDAANELADPLLRPYAQQYLASVVSARATTAADQVTELVEFFMPLGKCTVDHVAQALDMDRRTLSRRLADDGESFSSILHATRARFAERYLADERYSMTDVSARLGFAKPSAFSRWFHQQFGVSPSLWRAAATTASKASTT